MSEQNVEKKIADQDEIVQRLSQQLRKLQEESTEREKKIISELEARHAQERRVSQENNVENGKKLIRELGARYIEENKIMQKENAEKVEKLISDLEARHAQQIQRLQLESTQREEKSLSDGKVEHQAQLRVLVMALLRAKLERDRVIGTIAWIAVGTLVIIAFRGFIHGAFPKVLTFVTLSGFIGAIIFVGETLKRNSTHLQRSMEDVIHPVPILEENDGRPLRFLIFGFISVVLLGLTMFINFPLKVAALSPTAGPSDQKPGTPQGQTTDTGNSQAVLSSLGSVPVENKKETSPVATTTGEGHGKVTQNSSTPATITVKTTDNGGNFMGGSTQK